MRGIACTIEWVENGIECYALIDTCGGSVPCIDKIARMFRGPFSDGGRSVPIKYLTPAIPTVFILTYLSTRSIVHAIPLTVTWRSVVVINLKICEYKSHYPDVAQTALSFFGINCSGCQSSPSSVFTNDKQVKQLQLCDLKIAILIPRSIFHLISCAYFGEQRSSLSRLWTWSNMSDWRTGVGSQTPDLLHLLGVPEMAFFKKPDKWKKYRGIKLLNG